MSSSDELSVFVREALARGVSRAQVEEPGRVFWSHEPGKQCFEVTAREIRP